MKYKIFMILIFLLVVVTYMVDITDGFATSTAINTYGAAPDEITTVSVGSMLGTFWNLLSFNVTGLPVWINLFIFYPITLGVLFMGVDVVIHIIPFT